MLKHNYPEYIQIFKALADETRLKIIEILSSGEACACQLLENFTITQPTLSYHMKILCDSGIVVGRREGAWMYYRNSYTVIEGVSKFLSTVQSHEAKAISK